MKPTEKIETERCTLQCLCEKDLEEAAQLFLSFEVRRYLGGVISKETALKKLRSWMDADEGLYFCVRLKSSGAFIGLIDISPHHNPRYKELSYQFLPAAWGHGYAHETIKALIEYCADTLHLTRLVSETQTANSRSCVLLEKLGYALLEKLERFGCGQSLYMLDLSGNHT